MINKQTLIGIQKSNKHLKRKGDEVGNLNYRPPPPKKRTFSYYLGTYSSSTKSSFALNSRMSDR